MSLICGSQIIESNDFFSKLAVIKKADEQVDLNLVFSSFKFSKFCHILFTKLLVRNDIILSVITDLSEYDIFRDLFYFSRMTKLTVLNFSQIFDNQL